ncbi:MAG: transposase [Hydrogenibacillus schlegelii]|nr:transposase [Hydrogenibacillus schlegelii]
MGPGGRRALRDALVKTGFKSPYGLQARLWKMALEDALLTLERHWEAVLQEVATRISDRTSWSEGMKHYARWLLYLSAKGSRDWRRIQAIFRDIDIGALKNGPGAELMPEERARVRRWIRRQVRRRLTRPRVKTARSMMLDANMYASLTRTMKNGRVRQFVGVMTLEPKRRVVVPLAGVHAISGNIRIVLAEDRRVEVHVVGETKSVPPLSNPGPDEAGIDFGVTEVMTDETGIQYGETYGQALQDISEMLFRKSRRRQKLWALYRKYLELDPARARRIRRHNLGTRKQTRRNQRYRRRLENEINHAFNRFFAVRRPKRIAIEDLGDLRGKAKTKGLSRKVALWTWSIIRERIDFKAAVFGASVEPVNAAYSSQTCPACGSVDAKNRNGDRFHCRQCGFTGDADHVAAINILARLHDPEIRRSMAKEKVLAILKRRYEARQA